MLGNLRRGRHGAAIVLDGGGSGDRDCWRNSSNGIAIGFFESGQILPRIRGKTLDVAALSLGVERVERQRRFSAAGQAAHDDQFAARNVNVEVFEVIDATSPQSDWGLLVGLS